MTTLIVPKFHLPGKGITEDHKVAGRPLVLIRGGGDLATGVAARLFRSGFAVVITEIPKPLAVRRLVAFAEAIYAGEVRIEGIRGLRVNDPGAVESAIAADVIPVLIDPAAESRHVLRPAIIVDGRMHKAEADLRMDAAPMVVGLGPGFTASVDCHAVVETNRGHRMGRVVWDGRAEEDTGIPEPVEGFGLERVLRAPASGKIRALCDLGTVVHEGEELAYVGEGPVRAPFEGALRGLMHDGLEVEMGTKIGDLDPRSDPKYCFEISDKSLAVGGGVLEAVLSRPEIRRLLGG